MSTQQPGKDTIYIDVDDEITAIIDKVRGSHERIVALVLPKRATVLQSIVNMKLLKRTADAAKKHLVLITGETSLLPLAGSVGLYVAKSLQSKPEIPTVPGHGHHEAADDEAVNMADDEPLDASRPVGEYARRAPASVVAPSFDMPDEDAPIELDNAMTASSGIAGASMATGKKAGNGKAGSTFKIPNFNKFRIWLIIGAAALILLIILWHIGFNVMPKATVSVKTDSTAVKESLDIILLPSSNAIDPASSTIPATKQQVQKTLTQQVDATGQKDKGQKASGTIQFVKCNSNDTLSGESTTIPAGTGISANGLTFITQASVIVEPSNYKNNECQKNKKSSAIPMTAQTGGDKYNIAATQYSVANYPSISGTGSATTGGTSEIAKVVTQADIDSAKQKIAAQDQAAVKQELKQALAGKNQVAIEATYLAGEPEISSSANVNDEAATVTITEKITFSMMGARADDLKTVIATAVNKKIDVKKQKILDHGLNEATFKLQTYRQESALVTLSTTAIAGTDLNVDEIKAQVAGKKMNEAKDIIEAYPGVTEVNVKYSPFWVKAIPKKTSKITVTVEKPAAKNAQ